MRPSLKTRSLCLGTLMRWCWKEETRCATVMEGAADAACPAMVPSYTGFRQARHVCHVHVLVTASGILSQQLSAMCHAWHVTKLRICASCRGIVLACLCSCALTCLVFVQPNSWRVQLGPGGEPWLTASHPTDPAQSVPTANQILTHVQQQIDRHYCATSTYV